MHVTEQCAQISVATDCCGINENSGSVQLEIKARIEIGFPTAPHTQPSPTPSPCRAFSGAELAAY